LLYQAHEEQLTSENTPSTHAGEQPPNTTVKKVH
jgi:hypothetical protein